MALSSFTICATRLLPFLLLSLLLSLSQLVHAQRVNGFDLSDTSISKFEIFAGGPAKDGIPSIDEPRFISPEQVDYLKDDDIILGFSSGGISRAYPLRILVWHEIVNDVIGGKPVAVTYCPLCGTAMVFDRTIDGKVLSFGVSGLLYRSDVLMYDRQSQSLWTQLGMEAISGYRKGTTLTWLNSEHKTWKAWKQANPNGQVLSTKTGHRRNYSGEAYASYFAGSEPIFPVPQTRPELQNMTKVLGVIINGQAKAYSLDKLMEHSVIDDNVGGTPVKVMFDSKGQHPSITDAEGQPIPSVVVFWFAWQAFYADTELWAPKP